MQPVGTEPLLPDDPQQIGPYRLLGRLGEGGMGTVYLATGDTGRLVAIKVIRTGYASDHFAARFHAEVTHARRVASFCTAQVLDDGTTRDGRPYMVTEYIPGTPLSQQISRHGALDPGQLHGVAIGVATALAAIHVAGLVHRDLKPANVILSMSGPRVIDFGIARALDATSGPTQAGEVVGSPGWWAPEQVNGSEIGPWTDIFAWGCLVSYAGTGRHPYGHGDASLMAARVLNTHPDLGDLPPPLNDLVRRATSPDPTTRPTAQDLMLALVGGALPTTALPPTAPEPGTAVLPPTAQAPDSGATVLRPTVQGGEPITALPPTVQGAGPGATAVPPTGQGVEPGATALPLTSQGAGPGATTPPTGRGVEPGATVLRPTDQGAEPGASALPPNAQNNPEARTSILPPADQDRGPGSATEIGARSARRGRPLVVAAIAVALALIATAAIITTVLSRSNDQVVTSDGVTTVPVGEWAQIGEFRIQIPNPPRCGAPTYKETESTVGHFCLIGWFLQNEGPESAVEASPVTLVDDDGLEYGATDLSDAAPTSLPFGGTAVGTLVFDIPTNRTPAAVLFENGTVKITL